MHCTPVCLPISLTIADVWSASSRVGTSISTCIPPPPHTRPPERGTGRRREWNQLPSTSLGRRMIAHQKRTTLKSIPDTSATRQHQLLAYRITRHRRTTSSATYCNRQTPGPGSTDKLHTPTLPTSDHPQPWTIHPSVHGAPNKSSARNTNGFLRRASSQAHLTRSPVYGCA